VRLRRNGALLRGPATFALDGEIHEVTTLNYHFAGGLILGTLFLTVVVALPMKLGAKMVDAKRSGIIWCGFAAFVGLFAGIFASAIFGGAIGSSLASALGFAVAIRFMLGTTFLGAIGLMLIAMVLSFFGFALLATLGIIASSPMASGVAI
jgi:hypothetical protein